MPDAPTVAFLEWVAAAPRTRAEAVDVWRTSCPRLAVWEDALADGLVRVVASGGRAQVELTELGRRSLLTARAK